MESWDQETRNVRVEIYSDIAMVVEKQVRELLWARLGIRQEVGADGVGVSLGLETSSQGLKEGSDGSVPLRKKNKKTELSERLFYSSKVVVIPGVSSCTWTILAWRISPLQRRGWKRL